MIILQSKDCNRTNPQSIVPGGSTISVTYSDGTIIHYDKIKNVEAYAKKASKNSSVKLIEHGTNIIYKANV